MSDLILKDRLGRTLAKKFDFAAAIATGITNAVGSLNYKQVVAKGKDNPSESAPETEDTGFVEETVLAELTESTVQIPQNFAGLESVMTPTRLRNQFFEITEVHEMDGYVEITALHVFYQMRQNYTLWEPSENTKYSGASAIRNVMANTLFEPGFKVASDSTDMIRGDELDYARMNIVEAFLNPESGICTRYGLSLIRDNDTFYCLKDVGFDRGFVVQNKKNMLGVERTENTEDVITRVAPVGRDEDGNYVWLNRNGKKYIDSSHISEYPTPKAEIYITDIEIGADGTTAENIQQKLYEAAQKRFDEDEVDVPTVSMTVQFISLGDTEEYNQYKDLDKVYLYDVIHIKDTERGYSYGAQVIAVQHNVLTGLLESVTIGTPQPWDGVRKIGKWQVPEITKGKIRHGSIRAGEIADGAVKTDKIANGAVTADHMSQSADGHFKTIFAEELYISNTSEDGLLNTRFTVTEGLIQAEVTRATGAESSLGTRITQTSDAITLEATRATNAENSISGLLTVEAGKVAMIVGTNSGGNFIKAAEISTAINEAGEGIATIDANKVMIGNEKSTTVIAGKLNASDVTADYLSAKIATIPTLRGIAASFSGNVSTSSSVISPYIYLGVGGAELGAGVSAVRIDGPTNNQYKLQYKTYRDSSWTDAGTFSRATSLSGSWSGMTYTVTASPQGNTNSTTITLGLTGSGNIIGASVKNGNTTLDSAGAKLEEDTTNKKVICKLTGGSQSTIAQVSTSDTFDAGVAAGIPTGVTLGSKVTGTVWNVSIQRGAYSAVGKTLDLGAAYNEGWNAALAACGIPSGGTVYTGSWMGTLWSAPHQSATRYDNCVAQATGRQVSTK